MAECAENGCIRPVFARGLCSRHYEIARQSEAPCCGKEGCDNPQHAGGLCNKHYRATLKDRPEKCSVVGCERPVLAKGLCDAHRTRLRRIGNLDHTRPHDWGGRSAHPLYGTWKWLRRSAGRGMTCKEWLDDFWLFVREIGDKPTPKHILKKKTASQPHSKENSYWAQAEFKSPEEGLSHREYARIYQKHFRARNAEKVRGYELKRRQGVSLAQYEEMSREQGNLCAICGNPETALHPTTQQPRSLAVDHCHTTGRTRGLLCSACNTGIGNFKDRLDLLMMAAAYLQKHT